MERQERWRTGMVERTVRGQAWLSSVNGRPDKEYVCVE